jgi:hypothetical protein
VAKAKEEVKVQGEVESKDTLSCQNNLVLYYDHIND